MHESVVPVYCSVQRWCPRWPSLNGTFAEQLLAAVYAVLLLKLISRAQPAHRCDCTFTDVMDALAHDVSVQGLESELGAPGGQGFNDARYIVADEHKACHIGVSLHCASQGILCILQRPSSR